MGRSCFILGTRTEVHRSLVLIQAALCSRRKPPSCPLTWETSRQFSISPSSSYCLVTFCFPKLGWRQAFLKFLEPLNLLWTSVLCDAFSPEDIVTGDILIGLGVHSCVYISGVGWEIAAMIGMKVTASLGLLSALTAASLVWSFLPARITPLPAFLTGIVSLLLGISLFC